MIKKILISLVIFIVVGGSVAYLNKHHFIRIKNDLPEYTHGLEQIKSEMLAMRDGVKLDTRIYMPTGEGPWPVILIRHPYAPMDKVFSMFCDMYVRYGYACVLQLTRGQGDSEGDWEPVVNEPSDGSDTMYWIVEQDWMDGNMGMWGVSYLALTQWAAAFDYPKELKTFVPISMGTNFHMSLYEKGSFRHFATWWTMVMPDRRMRTDAGEAEAFIEVTKHMPHMEIDTKFVGQRLDWYREWVSATSLNSPTWSRPDAIQLSEVTAKLDIPILMMDGWYDPFFSAQFKDYLDLGSIEKSRMVVGPWNHLQQPSGDALDENLEGATKMSLHMSLEWFDHYLKGKPMEDDGGYLKTYDPGANKWRVHESWPPKSEIKRFQLANLVKANDCEGGELLATLASNDEVRQLGEGERIVFDYDPLDPVITSGGAGFIMPLDDEMKPGAVFQQGFCEREDVLTFTSLPMTEDLAFAGDIQVLLSVASSAEDTAFTAKLMDVQPDGQAINIRDSITTLAYRNDVPSPLVYEPGSVVEVAIDMWPMEWTIKKGHSLRLDISSSNFPAFNIHSNFAGPWAEQTQTKIATQTLYSPSYLVLPVLPKPTAFASR